MILKTTVTLYIVLKLSSLLIFRDPKLSTLDYTVKNGNEEHLPTPYNEMNLTLHFPLRKQVAESRGEAMYGIDITND